MIPKDLFEKIRRIQMATSRLVTAQFAGQYHSVFKGQGMEFNEVREYQRGDDIRSIEWNVTARTGHLYVKKYVEERELTVMILVDASGSCHFGTVNQLKSTLAAEIAAVLAFSAMRNQDKVGLIIFTDRIEKFLPPRKGIKNVLKVIREVLYFEPGGRGTDITAALEYLSKVTIRRSIAFVLSDFYEPVRKDREEVPQSSRLKKAIAIANKRHDLVAVTLNDPLERDLPSCGLVTFEDAETGESFVVDTASAGLRQQYHHTALKQMERRKQLFQSVGVDHIDIATDVPYTAEFIRFFRNRMKRKGS
jgi:uncharacterized protein (DUF58 family)